MIAHSFPCVIYLIVNNALIPVLNQIEIDRSGPAATLTEDQILEDEIRRANEQLAEVK